MQRGNSTTRDRHRSQIRRTHPPCHICEQPIDYSLRYPDPRSFVVDHIIPINRGGSDTLDNKAAAHSACNWAKSDKLAEEIGPRTYVTWRTW